jgi:hypothetical protein
LSSAPPQQPSLSYRDAGVDIDAGDRLVDRIKPMAARTRCARACSPASAASARCSKCPTRYREPVLVSGTDGVGTKLKLAFQLDRHDTVGIDLVAMSVNDILVQGAEPLFFLDYYRVRQACDVDTAAAGGQRDRRRGAEAGCALIGGETAEMPGMYTDGRIRPRGLRRRRRREIHDHRRQAHRRRRRRDRPRVQRAALQRLLARAPHRRPTRCRPVGGLRRAAVGLGDCSNPTRIYVRSLSSTSCAYFGEGHGPHHGRRLDRERAHASCPRTSSAELQTSAWQLAAGLPVAARGRNVALRRRDAPHLQLRHRDGRSWSPSTSIRHARCPPNASRGNRLDHRRDPGPQRRSRLRQSSHEAQSSILISGRGSNMQALLARRSCRSVSRRCFSNRPDGAGGSRSRATAGIATAVVDHRAYPDRAASMHLAAQHRSPRPRPRRSRGLHAHTRTSGLRTAATPAGLVNIHPSLLPAFPGLRYAPARARRRSSACTAARCIS